MTEHSGRRAFFRAFGASCVAFLALGSRRATANTTVDGLFASQFLKKGRVIEIPAGYYDPEQKLFIRADTGRPLIADQQLTGSWTYSQTSRCTTMAYPRDRDPYCVAQDSEQDQHPDGFKAGE